MNKINNSLYKSHSTIYTDPVPGIFSKIRFVSMFFVVFLFFFLPWISWNGNQAFLFDVFTARLYFFNFIFWPEDFSLFAILIIFLVLLLFSVTVYAGRIWCGFFCPQSIWLRISSFFTRLLEGNRNLRFKRDNEKLNFDLFFKKFLKHFIFILFSFFTGFTFVSYFIPIDFLINMFIQFDVFYWSFFWVLFFSFLTYFNVSWFREQFCFLVCPYARLQSVMFDENTLIVGYDYVRGEKRGHRKKGSDYKKLGLGDCIDCKKCVTCCPVGIDIRNGLQMECIGCAACIDACNSVMKKMNYNTGLIRYLRESEFTNNNFEKFSRFRLFAYIFFLILFFIFLCYGFSNRNLTQFSINRSQVQLYNLNKNNLIENNYVLKITNKTLKPKKYQIIFDDERFDFEGLKSVFLDPENTVFIDVKLILKSFDNKSRFSEVFFKIKAIDDDNDFILKKSKFIMPI